MSNLSESALNRLQAAVDEPDLTGTRYEIAGRVGAGGMGVVYRVRDPALGRDVALKIVRTSEPGSVAAARLRREAQTLARLEHPGIVPVHDAGTLADGRAYYVMKLVDGEPLDARAERGLDMQSLLTIIERICETVAFAHAHNVIHRDLKPQNVMIGEFGEVLVLDWGIARTDDASDMHDASTREPQPGDTAPGTAVGTPGWMAPEQAAGERVDARADVYAIGAMLHALLPALRDASSTDTSIVDGSRAPRRLKAIADKARAHDAADRYADARAMAADIHAFRAGAAVSAYRENLFERLERFARTYKTPIALVLAYILMRALLIIFTGR